MKPEQASFIRRLIHFYDERGWDWGLVVQFLCEQFNREMD